MDSQVLKKIVLIIAIIYVILNLIANYMCFEKAGESGWKAFIPIYNHYVFAMIGSGDSDFSWTYAVLTVIYSLLLQLPRLSDVIFSIGIIGLLAIFGGIADVIYSIKASYRFAKAFGVSNGFAVGFVIFPIIFLYIIAVDPYIKYCGPYNDAAVD